MATVHKFTRKIERIAREKAERLRQTVLDFGLPDRAVEDMMITIARHETGGVLPEWKFNMISPAQCLAVWDTIRQMDRPDLTRYVFDLVLTHLEPNTGAVTLTREEIAERVGTAPCHVSTVMTQLEQRNVIFRRRLKVEGMRGRGPVRYYLNPHAGWNGSLEVRAEQARQAPLPLDVIEGGKPSE
jgi:hypothetical protein